MFLVDGCITREVLHDEQQNSKPVDPINLKARVPYVHLDLRLNIIVQKSLLMLPNVLVIAHPSRTHCQSLSLQNVWKDIKSQNTPQ